MPISHAKSDTIADWSGTVTVGNSTGGTTTNAASNLVRPSDWNSNHLVSLSASEVAGLFNFGSGLTSSTAAGGISVGMKQVNFYEPFQLPNTASTMSSISANGSWYVDPFALPFQIDGGGINVFMANAACLLNGAVFSTGSTASVSKTMNLTNAIAIYQRGAGANSSRLESVWSKFIEIDVTQTMSVNSTTAGGGTTTGVIITNAATVSLPVSMDASGGITYGTFSQSGSTSTSVSTGASTLADGRISQIQNYISGSRMDWIPFSTTIDPGQYWMAHMLISSSGTTTAGANYGGGTIITRQSRIGLADIALSAFKALGNSTSNTVSNAVEFRGILQTTTSAASANMANADIRYTTGRMSWNYNGDPIP